MAIGKLRDALPHLVEAIHIVNRPEMTGVLLADHYADLADGFRSFDIAGTVDAKEIGGMRGDERIPGGDVP
jgi:hypothetical protein